MLTSLCLPLLQTIRNYLTQVTTFMSTTNYMVGITTKATLRQLRAVFLLLRIAEKNSGNSDSPLCYQTGPLRTQKFQSFSHEFAAWQNLFFPVFIVRDRDLRSSSFSILFKSLSSRSKNDFKKKKSSKSPKSSKVWKWNKMVISRMKSWRKTARV